MCNSNDPKIIAKYKRKNRFNRFTLVFTLLLLIGFCNYFYFALLHVQNLVLKEKIYDKQFEIDLLCDQIDYVVKDTNSWLTYDYQPVLKNLVAHIDADYGLYAELLDKNLKGLSKRTIQSEVYFDITEHKDVLDIVKNNQSGTIDLTLAFPKAKIKPYPFHIYYRWIPSDTSYETRYCIVIGVSKYSVITYSSEWLVYGVIALICLLAIIILLNFITSFQRIAIRSTDINNG
jgi:hypothetical protein